MVAISLGFVLAASTVALGQVTLPITNTGAGSVTVPAGYDWTNVTVQCWGGGGGGGAWGGGGGGGGAYAYNTYTTLSPGTYNYLIGSAGPSGASSWNGIGGGSTIWNYGGAQDIDVTGGGGGTAGPSGGFGGNGYGGSGGVVIAGTGYDGGSGGAGSMTGGGGGGSAGPSGPGGSGGVGSGNYYFAGGGGGGGCGSGGSGSNNLNGGGSAGSFPGGGGGGGGQVGIGCNWGANGEIIITYTLESRSSAIALTGMSNVTIITGGTGNLGTTVSNSAASGSNNLNYILTAAFQSGGGTLGTVTPATDSLAPGVSDSCTLSATSTNLGINTISFTASDPNASNSPQTTNATLTVLGHAVPSLTVANGNNQRVIVGTAGISAGLNLSNGTSGQSGLASLDVNSLGTSVSGGTGGALVASGSTQSYTALLSTGTLGTQTQTFSLNVGDDQTLSGASAPADISTSATLTVVTNRVVTASTANFNLVHVGSAVSQPIKLTTSGDDSTFTRVSVGNAGPDANGISVSGGKTPFFNSSTVTDQRTIGGVFSSVGTFNGSITLPTTGEGLPGEVPINVPVNYTAQVYSGQAEWNFSTGLWETAADWKDTVGGGKSGPPGVSGYATDTATFGPNSYSGLVVVALNSSAPVLSNLIFDNSDTSYLILQTGTGSFKLTSLDSSSPTAVTVISGTHTVDASILLQRNLLVSDSGSLTVSGNISDGGHAMSLTLDGGGELILSGNNTYTGGTVVKTGTLILDSNTAIANGTSLTIGAGGTFLFDPSEAGSPITNSASTVAVPEPSTFVLLGAGVIGMLRWGWRKRTHSAPFQSRTANRTPPVPNAFFHYNK